jgi:Ca2+-binding RTX toxin-like protein
MNERVVADDPYPQPPPPPPYLLIQRYGDLAPRADAGASLLYWEATVTSPLAAFSGSFTSAARVVELDAYGAATSASTLLGDSGVTLQFARIQEMSAARLASTDLVAAWVGSGTSIDFTAGQTSLQLAAQTSSGVFSQNLFLGISGINELSLTPLGGALFALSYTRSPSGYFGGQFSDTGSGNSSGVYARIFSLGAGVFTTVTPEFLVNAATAGNQYGSDAAALGANLLVVWNDQDASIKAKIYNSAGGVVLADTPLVTAAIAGAPSVAALSNGNFAIAWTQGGEVYARVFAPSGAAISGAVQVNDFTLNNQEFPEIAASRDGGFIVSFIDSSFAAPDTSDPALRAQSFDASGARSGSNILVPTTVAGNHASHELTTLSDGRVAAAWANASEPTASWLQILDDRGALITGNGTSETVYGADAGPFANTQFVAQGGDDVFHGLGGNDYFYAGLGADLGFGGAGVDVLIGEAGNDTLTGGADQDYLFGGDNNDTLNGEDGVDVLHGEGGDDVALGGNGIDYFYAGAGNDAATGGNDVDIFVMDAGNDAATGEAGNDYVYAGNDNDTLLGGSGVDVLQGEAGNDTIDGGADIDYVYLGTGDDTFVMDTQTPGLNVDVLYDFTPGAASGDVLRLLNTGWTTIAQVQAAMVNTGNGYSILTLDADTQIWIIGVTPGQLAAGDAVFS